MTNPNGTADNDLREQLAAAKAEIDRLNVALASVTDGVPPISDEIEHQLIQVRGDLLEALNIVGKERWELCCVLQNDPNRGITVALKRRRALIAVIDPAQFARLVKS